MANRSYTEKNPEIVSLLVENYFKALTVYSSEPAKLKEDIIKTTGTNPGNVDAILEGVKWIDLPGNVKWYGFITENAYTEEELVVAIDSTIDILIENGDFNDNPLPNKDAATIINSKFIKQLFQSSDIDLNQTNDEYSSSIQKKFTHLSDSEWSTLTEVGVLKIRPITFMSGTSKLETTGKLQIDYIISNIKHYPNFRILIKGHTGLRGDEQENRLLSEERARAVAEYMITMYNVNTNRIKATGVGSQEPLQRVTDESSRAYNDRLKRVEIHLVNEN